jgi:hypothetical protein
MQKSEQQERPFEQVLPDGRQVAPQRPCQQSLLQQWKQNSTE